MKLIQTLFGLLAASSLCLADDNLNWLRDDSRQNERVLTHLIEQNHTTEKFQQSYAPLTQNLLNEWDAMSAVRADKPWVILDGQEWSLSSEQGNFRLLKRSDREAKSEIVYDFAPRQTQHQYYQIGQWRLQNNTLIFTEDISGEELYQAVQVNLATGETNLILTGIDAGVLLSPTSNFAYFIIAEEQTQRPYQIVSFDTQTGIKRVLWQEDKQNWINSFYLAADKRYAILQSNSDSSSEQKILQLDSGKLSRSLRKPTLGVEYYADVAKGNVYINSNVNGDFSLFKMPLNELFDNASHTQWVPFTNATNNVEQFYLFDSGVVALNTENSLLRLTVYSYAGKQTALLPLSTKGRTAWLSAIGDYHSNKVRIRSMSMTTPPLWEEFDVSTLTKTRLSQDYYAGFNSQDYVTQRLMIASQGVEVPVTLAYRKDTLKQDSSVVLYGYGAYGFTMKPYFMPQIISLLDQGVIYAIAHVRGGGYFGPQWHQQGRGVGKINAIQDFTNVARKLKHFNNGKRDIYALGSSAGGTLVAGAINQDPTLFSGAVLKVPFVDVVASMSDTSLPLTAQQYGEWGDPSNPEELSLMQAYDPILNITKANYPPLLVQVGLNDKRVPYWEGAKYIAKVSENSKSAGPYLLQTDFNSGHSMDRRKAKQQQAKEYAFLLSLIEASTAEQ